MPTESDSQNSFLRARDDKRIPLQALFRSLGPHVGPEAMRRMNDYLDAVRDVTVDELRVACEVLRDTWENTFTAPPPAGVRAAAARFRAKSRSEMRYEADRLREDNARRNTMTPMKVKAEILRRAQIPLPDDPCKRRVEVGTRESLQRIVDRWDGKAVSPLLSVVRDKGDGGLNAIGDFVEGV